MRSGSAYLGERIWWRILFWNQARNAFINYQIWHPIKTSIPSRGSILLVASCYGNQNKFWPDGPLGSYADLRCTVRTKKTKVVKTGLLIFCADAEPRISSKSAKSREIHNNARNPAKFARNLTKYMSAQHIWKLSWLLGLLTTQHPKTTRRCWINVAKNWEAATM